jgi:hypothetical protein
MKCYGILTVLSMLFICFSNHDLKASEDHGIPKDFLTDTTVKEEQGLRSIVSFKDTYYDMSKEIAELMQQDGCLAHVGRTTPSCDTFTIKSGNTTLNMECIDPFNKPTFYRDGKNVSALLDTYHTQKAIIAFQQSVQKTILEKK